MSNSAEVSIGATKVLVVDDETYLAELVATALRYEGFATAVARTGREALAEVKRFQPDLMILDIMLPDGSGLDTCQRLRQSGWQAPVIFLTARDETEDKIAGLTVGGDDYVTKPFSVDELVARVRAILRRARLGQPVDGKLRFADLVMNENTHEVSRAGTPIELTPTEYQLLRYLLLNAGQVLSKRQILDHVWDYDFAGSDAVVQTYISYLRRKIDSIEPTLIHTVPRVGYLLRLPRDTSHEVP